MMAPIHSLYRFPPDPPHGKGARVGEASNMLVATGQMPTLRIVEVYRLRYLQSGSGSSRSNSRDQLPDASVAGGTRYKGPDGTITGGGRFRGVDASAVGGTAYHSRSQSNLGKVFRQSKK